MVLGKEGNVIILISQMKSEGLRKQGQAELYKGLSSESCFLTAWCFESQGLPLLKKLYTSEIQRAAGKLQVYSHHHQNKQDLEMLRDNRQPRGHQGAKLSHP